MLNYSFRDFFERKFLFSLLIFTKKQLPEVTNINEPYLKKI